MSRFSLALSAFLLVAFTIPFQVVAQRAPLPLGQVSGVTQMDSCPSGFMLGMTCYQAQMTCPSTASLGFTYGVANPTRQLKGTIVFLGGSDGTLPYGVPSYAGNY